MKIQQRFFIFLSYIFLFFSLTNEVFARGGGGGSGGGGGGGGGFHSGSGGSLNLQNPVDIYFLIVILVAFGCLAVISIIGRRAWTKKIKEALIKSGTNDPVWEEGSLRETVANIFMRFQKDWSDNNAEAMKEYCAPKFQERMSLELSVLRLQNRKNFVNNPSLNSVTIQNVDDEADNASDNFDVVISAQANDQLIDLTTGKILMTENEPFTEYWNFVRHENIWQLNSIKQSTENSFMIENSVVQFAQKNNFFYDPDFGWLMLPNKGVIFGSAIFKNSDINNHVVGMFNGKVVEFYTFLPNLISRSTNYLVAQTTLPVNYNDILVRRRRSFWNFAPRGLRYIKTESNDFNKKFCLYAHPSDQIDSFVLLAPDFMEEIYNLPFELNIEIVGSFLYFYVKGRKNVDENEMLRLISRAFDSMQANR